MQNMYELVIVIIGLAAHFDSGWCYPPGLSIFRFFRDIADPIPTSADRSQNINGNNDGARTEKPSYPVSHWNIVYIVMKIDPELRYKKVENRSHDDNMNKGREEQIDFDKIEERLNSNGYDERKLRGSGYLFRKDIHVDDHGYAHIHYYFRKKNGEDDNDDNYYSSENGYGLREGIDVYQKGLKPVYRPVAADNKKDESGKVEEVQINEEESTRDYFEKVEIKNEGEDHGYQQKSTSGGWEAENDNEEGDDLEGDEEDSTENEDEEDDGDDDDYTLSPRDWLGDDEAEEAHTDEYGHVIREFVTNSQSRVEKQVDVEESKINIEGIKSDDQLDIKDKSVIENSDNLVFERKTGTNTKNRFTGNSEINSYQMEKSYLENRDEPFTKMNDNKKEYVTTDDYIDIDVSETWSIEKIDEEQEKSILSPEEFYDDKDIYKLGKALEIRNDDEEFLDSKETEMGDSEVV